MKTKKYQEFVTEMAQITKKATKLTVNGTPLKNIKTSDIDENIMFWRNDKANFMFEEGFSMCWFLDDDTYKKDFNGDNLLFFPMGRFSFDASPITDIWKKNTPLQKHIIGCIQADTSEKQIFIDMMSVRSGYMKNGINKHMIDSLIGIFPNAVLKFSLPTKMGKEFINKYYPTAKIEGVLTKEDLLDIITKIKNDDSVSEYTPNDFRTAMKILKIDISSTFNIRGDRLRNEEQWNLFKTHIKNMTEEDINNINYN